MSVTYITDLNCAYDRFMAKTCMAAKLPVHVYFPHEDFEGLFKPLKEIQEEIRTIADYASSCTTVHKGPYSPKKHLRTEDLILARSDIIIAIHDGKIELPPTPVGKTVINLYETS